MIYNIGTGGGGGGDIYIWNPTPWNPSHVTATVEQFMEIYDAVVANKRILVPLSSGEVLCEALITEYYSDDSRHHVYLEYDMGYGMGFLAWDLYYMHSVGQEPNISSEKTYFSIQPELESGTNIKTINNNSILGSGNLTIDGGCTVQIERW